MVWDKLGVGTIINRLLLHKPVGYYGRDDGSGISEESSEKLIRHFMKHQSRRYGSGKLARQ